MSARDIFNKMADDYDEIRDLWYAWLFSRLHYIIAESIILRHNPTSVLDVGCGTGFQSFLHAAAGAIVVGIDIAEELIKVAQQKSSSFDPKVGMELFPVHFDFVERYNQLVSSLLVRKVRSSKYHPPVFQVADATNLPFVDQTFDHVNCCGSTLSFIGDHYKALSEVARVLKPNGTLLLEVESRWNMDLIWPFIDLVLKGRLGYRNSLNEALRALLAPATKYVFVNYPFGEPEDPVKMKLKLFTLRGLRHDLSDLNFRISSKKIIHSVTSLIPTTLLDMTTPPKQLRTAFSFLSRIEERSPISLPGCSLVILAYKIQR